MMDVHWYDERILITYFILSQFITSCSCNADFYSFNGECKTDESWRKFRVLYAECRNLTKYHCAKNFRQDDSFIEGCAMEKVCLAGEEPLLSYYKNQIWLKEPEVVCRKCETDYYNPTPKNSSTYSQCFKKKNNCLEKDHKIKCAEGGPTSERLCRCDARRGYYPGYPHQDGEMCSRSNYICENKQKCDLPNGGKQELLLNYTCAPVCKAGFMRTEESDECVEDQTFTMELSKIDVTTSTTTRTTLPLRITSLLTREQTTNVVISTATPEKYDNGKMHVVYVVIGVLVACACAAIGTVLIVFLCLYYKRNKRKKSQTETDIEMKHLQTDTSSHDTVGNATGSSSSAAAVAQNLPKKSSPRTTHIFKTVYIGTNIETKKSKYVNIHTNKKNYTESDDSIEVEEDEDEPLLSDEHVNVKIKQESFDVHTPHLKSYSLAQLANSTGCLDSETISSKKPMLNLKKAKSVRQISVQEVTDVKKSYDLNPDEYKKLVKKVYEKSWEELVANMNPITLIDSFTSNDIFTTVIRRDIAEEKNTSEKSRKILQRLWESAPNFYLQFKDCLFNSQQYACLQVVQNHERVFVLNDLRKSEKGRCTDEDHSMPAEDITFMDAEDTKANLETEDAEEHSNAEDAQTHMEAKDDQTEFQKCLQKNAKEDELSSPLIPRDWLKERLREGNEEYIALKSTGDGNCLFNSICWFIKGREDRGIATELRRAVADELSNEDSAYKYGIIHEHIAQCIEYHDYSGPDQLLLYHAMINDENYANNLSFDNLEGAIRKEGEKTREDRSWCSMLQILALANILNQDIICLFPENDWSYRDLYHGTIHPSKSNKSTVPSLSEAVHGPIILLWAAMNLDNSPNTIFHPDHIVPVFRKSLILGSD